MYVTFYRNDTPNSFFTHSEPELSDIIDDGYFLIGVVKETGERIELAHHIEDQLWILDGGKFEKYDTWKSREQLDTKRDWSR